MSNGSLKYQNTKGYEQSVKKGKAMCLNFSLWKPLERVAHDEYMYLKI